MGCSDRGAENEGAQRAIPEEPHVQFQALRSVPPAR
jgi:hypothetical protein